MIRISDKHNCCGCEACMQVCPKQCIAMTADEQGFLYPRVDESVCIDCGLCERVCPELHPLEARTPVGTYASMNKDEAVRMQSSSGGIFTMLAEAVLAEGGVVFGVKFADDWSVEHAYTETRDGLAAFRGSKYVQSRVGTAYADALRFLKAGRKVLFSGTSCQIAGLRRFLRKDYEGLIAVEVVCHGVPSPMVWRSYLEHLKSGAHSALGKNSVAPVSVQDVRILDVNFRDKKEGWQKYGFSLRMTSASKAEQNTVFSSVNEKKTTTEDVCLFDVCSKNLYMRLFLSDISLRPSCYACKAKSGASGADIALADFWNINKRYADWNDDRGASLVLVYTERGATIFNQINSRSLSTDYAFALRCNRAIEVCAVETKHVARFWNDFLRNGWKRVPTLIRQSVPLKLRIDLFKMRVKRWLGLK